MPLFFRRSCDPQQHPLGCFIYSDILTRVDAVLPPIISEAAQNSIPPQNAFYTQLVINPAAGGGRLKPYIDAFRRRAQTEPYLRIMGDPILTSPDVAAMTTAFQRLQPSNHTIVYVSVLAGDGGLSKVMESVQGDHNGIAVVPVRGVGTAGDIPRAAGAWSYTERLPHVLVRSTTVHYHGVRVAGGGTGEGVHFHSIATGVGGELFRLVEEVRQLHPLITRLKNISPILGVLPYLLAFGPLFRRVRQGELVVDTMVHRGEEMLFRGKSCGTITPVVPGMGGVTRIPGIDPTHGQARLLILPENASEALATILEGIKWRVLSLVPGIRLPDRIASLSSERQIALGPEPVQITFLDGHTPMQVNGDYAGDAATFRLSVEPMPVTMAVNRSSPLAELSGTLHRLPSFESLMRLGELGVLGAGLVGAVHPGVSEEDYRDLTHKVMLAILHGSSMAVLTKYGRLLPFHLRLLSLAPAYLLLGKLAEGLEIGQGKWRYFADTYLPIAVISSMQYLGISPSVGNAIRLLLPRLYAWGMGSRLVSGTQRSLLPRLAMGAYHIAYFGALIVGMYHALGNLGERNRTATSWIESTLRSDAPWALAEWGTGTLRRMGMSSNGLDFVQALAYAPQNEAEAVVKNGMVGAEWKKMDDLAGRMQRLAVDAVQRKAWENFDRPLTPQELIAHTHMGAARIDTQKARWDCSLLAALMHYDADIVTAAGNPGLFVLAAMLAFHRRHPDPATPPPAPYPFLQSLAFLGLESTGGLTSHTN